MAHINPDNELSICKASPSMTSIVSGIQTFAFNYFRSKFPKNYFKDTYMGTSLTSKSFRHNPGANRMMPYLAMNTTFEAGGGDLFVQDWPLWHTTTYYVFKNLKRNYRLVFEDEENDIRIYAVPRRYKFNFNYNIILQTEMAAWNVLTYIDQQFENGGYNYVNNIRIPAEIPTVMIHNIAKRLKIDLNTKEGSQDMKDYLMTHALGPIEGKTNPGTGLEKYEFGYTTNVLLNYPDLANYDKEIRNLISHSSTVRYAMSAELWTPSNFILEIKGDYKEQNVVTDVTDLGEDVLNFSMSVEQKIIPKVIDEGFQYITRANFETSVNEKIDTLPLDRLVMDKIERNINVLREYDADLSKVIKFVLFKDNEEVSPKQYRIDYRKLELELENPGSNTIFTIVCYSDLKKMNLIDDLIQKGRKRDIRKLEIY